MKNKNLKITLILLAIIIILLIIVDWSKTPLTGFDKEIQKIYKRTTIGISQNEVINLLRKPDSSGDLIDFNNLSGIKLDNIEGTKRKCNSHMIWHNGSINVYIIGFDDNRKVMTKAQGKI